MYQIDLEVGSHGLLPVETRQKSHTVVANPIVLADRKGKGWCCWRLVYKEGRDGGIGGVSWGVPRYRAIIL